MSMEVTQVLKDTENALRDFIASEIEGVLGKEWVLKCGVTEERIKQWQERKTAEEKRHFSGTIEERILYYADFYDLKTILEKNWDKIFSKVFSDKKIMILYLDILNNFRDLEAHRRELLPHQKNLILGIAGEIRSSIIRFRSKKETDDDCFPRIESIRDNIGTIWTVGCNESKLLYETNKILHPGDTLDFVITASDPEDLALKFCYRIVPFNETIWQEKNTFSIKISEKNISKGLVIEFYVQSPRQYHAANYGDDYASFVYKVLPNK